MPRVNLLPWREAQRKERQKNFAVATMAAVLVGAAVIWWAHMWVQGRIDYQNARNQKITQEIALLDEKIADIRNLRLRKERLLLRKAAIEALQRTRPEVVHLFDELVKVVPDGVFLTELTQSNKRLLLKGVAESSTRVSTLMRNIDASAWLADPQLQVVQTGGGQGGPVRQAAAAAGHRAEFTVAARQVGVEDKPEEEVAQ
jgi:type IV pilus assembly protein PilN